MIRKAMMVVWMTAACTCFAQQVDLKSLDKLASKAKEKTEVEMDEATLKSAQGFLNEKNTDEAQAKDATKNLKGIFVRSYEFENKNAYSKDDIQPIFDQLKAPAWSRFIRNEEESELTEIWMHKTNGAADGLLIVSIEEEEVTVVNVVGSANLASLAAIGGIRGVLPDVTDQKKPDSLEGNKND
jgi:hypothetical protein